MRYPILTTATALLVGATLAGCNQEMTLEVPATQTEEHAHVHEGDDALVWVEEDFEHEGYQISLGHHGEHLHAASFVEPAVAITRDGRAVADAKVYNSLLAADRAEVLREEVATVYEPETPEEPAHYAQGGLHLPKGSEQLVIRFRIELPGATTPLTRDITVHVEN